MDLFIALHQTKSKQPTCCSLITHLVLRWVRIGLLLAAKRGSAKLRLPERRLHLPVLLLEMRRRLAILLLLGLLHVLGRVTLPAKLLLLLLWWLAERSLLELLRRPPLLLLLQTAWLTAERLATTGLPPGLSERLEPAPALMNNSTPSLSGSTSEVARARSCSDDDGLG